MHAPIKKYMAASVFALCLLGVAKAAESLKFYRDNPPFYEAIPGAQFVSSSESSIKMDFQGGKVDVLIRIENYLSPQDVPPPAYVEGTTPLSFIGYLSKKDTELVLVAKTTKYGDITFKKNLYSGLLIASKPTYLETTHKGKRYRIYFATKDIYDKIITSDQSAKEVAGYVLLGGNKIDSLDEMGEVIEEKSEGPEPSSFFSDVSLSDISAKMKEYSYVGLLSPDIQSGSLIFGHKRVIVGLTDGSSIIPPEYQDKLKGNLPYYTSEGNLPIAPLGFRKGKQLAFAVDGKIVKTIGIEVMKNQRIAIPIDGKIFNLSVTIEEAPTEITGEESYSDLAYDALQSRIDAFERYTGLRPFKMTQRVPKYPAKIFVVKITKLNP